MVLPTNALPINQWAHYAVERYENNISIYIDGIVVLSFANSSIIPSGTITIGNIPDVDFFTGFLDANKITIGRAIYKTEFIPPVSAPDNLRQDVELASPTYKGVSSSIPSFVNYDQEDPSDKVAVVIKNVSLSSTQIDLNLQVRQTEEVAGGGGGLTGVNFPDEFVATITPGDVLEVLWNSDVANTFMGTPPTVAGVFDSRLLAEEDIQPLTDPTSDLDIDDGFYV